ncbi:hypothetical protein BDB00DRAFT_836230 [Zychaea mexicana]|uniref:uncharacterized protein n=1 Tax=Zychaea mexicana TaxID=64656 RepID=UPI0022FE85A3|nr:uncharacterized protein BDB00DRAFT_836230 [Zychaea mexicana]KAI9490817.1 hypothetical protein BDB00DRAFT_836230 [Zychaea mexicana]
MVLIRCAIEEERVIERLSYQPVNGKAFSRNSTAKAVEEYYKFLHTSAPTLANEGDYLYKEYGLAVSQLLKSTSVLKYFGSEGDNTIKFLANTFPKSSGPLLLLINVVLLGMLSAFFILFATAVDHLENENANNETQQAEIIWNTTATASGICLWVLGGLLLCSAVWLSTKRDASWDRIVGRLALARFALVILFFLFLSLRVLGIIEWGVGLVCIPYFFADMGFAILYTIKDRRLEYYNPQYKEHVYRPVVNKLFLYYRVIVSEFGGPNILSRILSPFLRTVFVSLVAAKLDGTLRPDDSPWRLVFVVVFMYGFFRSWTTSGFIYDMSIRAIDIAGLVWFLLFYAFTISLAMRLEGYNIPMMYIFIPFYISLVRYQSFLFDVCSQRTKRLVKLKEITHSNINLYDRPITV